jgi:negative regulator of flagellin synthesis FlgM
MTRIDGLNPLTTSRTAQGQGAQGIGGGGDRDKDSEAAQVGGPQDNITLSTRSRIVADVSGYVASAPDVRAGRVADLKAAIANGTYRVSAGDIAARLLATGTFGAES